MENLPLEQQQEILANINKGIIGTRTTGYWNRIANIDFETRSLNTDYKVKVANTDYKARTSNFNYKTKTKNTDYKKVAEKISKSVLQYDLQGNFIQEFKSIKDAKIFLGKNKHNGDISNCIKGKQKTAFGFIWKLKDN